jgi:hypothetical protein
LSPPPGASGEKEATMQDVFDEQPKGAQQGETQPTEQQPQEQQPQQQPAEGEGAAPPAASETAKHVPLEALEAERKGRQDWKEKAIRAEAELENLRRQQQAIQQGPQPMEPLQQMQVQMVNERFNLSETLVREKHADVDEVIATFKEAMAQNPALMAAMHQHRHPWQFAYDEGKRLKFAAEIGNDPEAYRKKVEAEVMAKLAASPQSQQPAAPALPQSLAGARSAGARGNTFTGPTPMENLFKN